MRCEFAEDFCDTQVQIRRKPVVDLNREAQKNV